jgi:4,5-DOPA dioxygenase extradiol
MQSVQNSKIYPFGIRRRGNKPRSTLVGKTALMSKEQKRNKMPAIFFGHGSPMNAIEENNYSKSWQEIVKKFPRPKAILSISAHWETSGSRLTANQKQKTIHDFYGFPPELFAVEYNPDGDLTLVERIQNLIPEIKSDASWGLDHGTWSILVHAFPNADIPTIQLSLDRNKTLEHHFELAQKLRILREEGVLIIGSGNIVHNLRLLDWRGQTTYSWAREFNEEIKRALLAKDFQAILNYQNFPGAKESVPSAEHFLPLIYILGLMGEGEKIEIFNDQIALGSIAMTSVALGL